MFGISFHKLPTFTKFLYAAIFFALVGGAIWWGMQQLDKKDDKKTQKRKKSPKKDWNRYESIIKNVSIFDTFIKYHLIFSFLLFL